MSTVAAPRLPTTGARGRFRARALSLPRPRPELAALLVLARPPEPLGAQRATAGRTSTTAPRCARWRRAGTRSSTARSTPAGVMTVDKPPLALWVQALSVKRLRLPLAEPARAAGADGRRVRRARVRPRRAAASGARGGLRRGRSCSRRRRSRSRSRATTTPTRCSSCAASARCGRRARARGRPHALARRSRACASGSASRRRWPPRCWSCPRIAAAWLWVAPARPRCAAIGQLRAGGAAMVAVGVAWPLLVCADARRPSGRGSPARRDNSIWSLIIGYNGLGRLDGQAGGPRPAVGGRRSAAAAARAASSAATPGALRLLDASLGGQAGWLLGLRGRRRHRPRRRRRRLRRADPRTGWLIAVGGAFADDRRRVQLRQGHLPPVLRVASSRRSRPRWSAPARPAALRATVLARIARRRWRSPPASRRARRPRATPTARSTGSPPPARRSACSRAVALALAPAPRRASSRSPPPRRAPARARRPGPCRRSATPPAAPSRPAARARRASAARAAAAAAAAASAGGGGGRRPARSAPARRLAPPAAPRGGRRPAARRRRRHGRRPGGGGRSAATAPR